MHDELDAALRAEGFACIETHISRVYLRDDDVYKVKRPVALGFLDFASLHARKRACDAEVSLNRRLAPDVYLGVVAIVPGPGPARFVAAEEAHEHERFEWAVHMRRLSEQTRADVLLASSRLTNDDVAAAARMLARFHASARCDALTADFGRPTVVQGNVEENFQQVEGSIAEYLREQECEELEAYQRSFLSRNVALFEQRAREGRVRDGHGDLRLEHLYRRGTEFIAIDCIEFNERFRFADVCADLAFLAMDLRYRDRVDLAEWLVSSYARESGDYELYRLLDFYESYRAFVRAKICSILARDRDVSPATREQARHDARRYYLLALSAARRPLEPPRLVVTCGLIGTGKSSLANALALELPAVVLSADHTRKELLGVSPTTPQRDEAFSGAYAPEMSQRVYATLLLRAEHVLASGRSVVLDAGFRLREDRAAVLSLSRRLACRVLFVDCRCPHELVKQRLRARAERASVSDGRLELFDDIVAAYEHPDELESEHHLVLDTSGALAENVAAVLARLRT